MIEGIIGTLIGISVIKKVGDQMTSKKKKKKGFSLTWRLELDIFKLDMEEY